MLSYNVHVDLKYTILVHTTHNIHIFYIFNKCTYHEYIKIYNIDMCIWLLGSKYMSLQNTAP